MVCNAEEVVYNKIHGQLNKNLLLKLFLSPYLSLDVKPVPEVEFREKWKSHTHNIHCKILAYS